MLASAMAFVFHVFYFATATALRVAIDLTMDLRLGTDSVLLHMSELPDKIGRKGSAHDRRQQCHLNAGSAIRPLDSVKRHWT